MLGGRGWEDEMVALEAQLNASVRMQIESTREGIQRLGASRERLRAISTALTRVTSLCRESDGLVQNYPTIKLVSRTTQNFRLVRSVFDQFTHLDETVTRTEGLLQQDATAGTSANLLVVYQHLSRLEAFRTQTMALMREAPSTVTYTLRRYFRRLDDLSAAFDQFYWQIPRDFYRLAVGGEQAVLVRVMKVLDRMDRGARPRMLAILDDWVAAKFAAAAAAFGRPPAEDIEGATQSVAFWLADMTAIRDAVVPCFPPDMQMLDWFTLTFHRHVHGLLAQCLAPEVVLEAHDILNLLRWAKEYHGMMQAELGMAPGDLEPALLDDRQEARLIRLYVEVARAKVAEWIGNLFDNERLSFTRRPAEPDLDADNRFISPAAVDLIQIIKQHIQTTAESGQGKLVLEVITDTVKVVADFQLRLGDLMAAELERYLAAPERVAPHFEPHLIMLGNTGLRWVTSLQEELISSLDSMVAAEYLTLAAKSLKSLSDGFLAIAKQASSALTRIIFHAVSPAIGQLFTPPAWYGAEALVETITVTFGDFFGDYKDRCADFLMSFLVAEVLEAFLLAYLQQLRAKPARLLAGSCAEYFQADLATCADFFSAYRDPRRVEKLVDPVRKFVGLVTSSQKMVYLEFFAFWKVFPDMPLAIFEEVLAKRDDLDKYAIRDIVETCRKKTLEERPVDAQPSLFAKLAR